MLLNRLIMTVVSHLFYRDLRPRLYFDRAAAREILVYSKFTIPSSLLTLCLNQFDKVIFLRLFDLRLLGIYGLALNIAGSVESLISRVSSSVLYPRCAHNFRQNPDTAARLYYTENIKLFAAILAMPAAISGAAHLVISLLYDPRYSQAGSVLQALAIRAVLLSLATPAEDLLISAAQFHVILTGNILRGVWIVVGSFLGYYLFGFMGLLIAKYEFYKVGFALAVGMASYAFSAMFLALFPGVRIKF